MNERVFNCDLLKASDQQAMIHLLAEAFSLASAALR